MAGALIRVSNKLPFFCELHCLGSLFSSCSGIRTSGKSDTAELGPSFCFLFRQISKWISGKWGLWWEQRTGHGLYCLGRIPTPCSCHPKATARVQECLGPSLPRTPSSRPLVSIGSLRFQSLRQPHTRAQGASSLGSSPMTQQLSVHTTGHPVTQRTACFCLLIRLLLFAPGITIHWLELFSFKLYLTWFMICQWGGSRGLWASRPPGPVHRWSCLTHWVVGAKVPVLKVNTLGLEEGEHLSKSPSS